MSAFRYGDDPSQYVELTLPDGTGPHPCVVLLHGGFWRAQYGLELMRPLARAVVDRGLAAANVEYRRVGQPGGGYPGTLDDVAAALDVLAADPRLDQLVLVGHSAGGHLALRSARPHAAAVVSLAGVGDLVDAARAGLGEGAAAAFLGGTPDEVPDRFAAAAPPVPLGVPTLLVHGDADDRVPVQQSRRYADAARAAGDDVELVELPGVGHREVIDPAGPAWREVDRRLATWTAGLRS